MFRGVACRKRVSLGAGDHGCQKGMTMAFEQTDTHTSPNVAGHLSIGASPRSALWDAVAAANAQVEGAVQICGWARVSGSARREEVGPASKQILHEKIGIDPGDVHFINGDTDRVAFGMGSNGSRSMVTGGTALVMAADKIIERGKQIAAQMMEASVADIEFEDAKFTVVDTDRDVTLKQVAIASFQPSRLPKGMEPGLIESATCAPEQATYPNGCHVCEVEVDPETGTVELVNYIVVDDVGTVINPLTLAGQIHGGVAQGVGQVLMEQVVYEKESGQLLTASFMDYAMPRADTMCNVVIRSNPVPTARNLLGTKGAGEAGCIGALPAVMIAIVHALEPLGVRELDMPATSERVWQAIQSAHADVASRSEAA
jgi:carbon-monoxide dehydrogenase large subunit